MATTKKHTGDDSAEVIVARAKDFWERNSKLIVGVCTAVIVLIGGWYIYQNVFKKPKELKAADAMFKAEEYYRLDSINLALNGDGQSFGFLRIISRYGGTDAGNLANFYAGSCYIKLGDNEKAIKYLKKFHTSSKLVQARAYKLIGDASSDLGRNSDALEYYKKAAHHFEKDDVNSPDYLFVAAYFAERVLKNHKEAIDLFKELKQKYPRSVQGQQADGYLAQLGVYDTETE